jgi:hypothetical protein
MAVALVTLAAVSATVAGGGVAGAAPRARSYAGTVRLTVADLQDYWSSELPEQGEQACVDLVPGS